MKSKDLNSKIEVNEGLEQHFLLSMDLFCIAKTSGEFIRLNSGWEKVLGYTEAELKDLKFLDLVHPDDRAKTQDAVSKLENQEEVLNFENRYRCKDGTYRFFEWRSRPKRNLIYAVARDITERKRAEEATQAAERRYRNFFENVQNCRI